MSTADLKSDAPTPRPLTRANSGIGRTVAIGLRQAGVDVVVNYVAGEDGAQDVVRTIGQHGVKAYAHLADVSNEAQLRDMFSTMVKRLGTIEILVNNAGLQRDSPFQDMTLARWNMVTSVNLTGQFLCARAAIVELLRRGCVPKCRPALARSFA
jgi:glucose 1-dehydrogenase